MIERARADDLAQVLDLLERLHLPLDGVPEHIDTMIVARERGHVVGVAAVELYAGGALLRSVAVEPALQGRRLGQRLTEVALDMAQAHGADTAFLLTTTAEKFFPRFGFEQVGRDDVPGSVQASVEFRSACPASAVVMRKRLLVTGRGRITS